MKERRAALEDFASAASGEWQLVTDAAAAYAERPACLESVQIAFDLGDAVPNRRGDVEGQATATLTWCGQEQQVVSLGGLFTSESVFPTGPRWQGVGCQVFPAPMAGPAGPRPTWSLSVLTASNGAPSEQLLLEFEAAFPPARGESSAAASAGEASTSPFAYSAGLPPVARFERTP